ncbi:MAG TPA: Gfo/Idh/MocA family oxidoreductase [Candidatus Hydrogenedentes bacterium]|nr:Gfo/Idh/MocA family oxidoreductase [Candidatus Hydrogenedentota bacterium]HOV59984.1 Gfo/Idh/MocA family oxidoreductase [Candidatus Hydrogenedentota bacterium]
MAKVNMTRRTFVKTAAASLTALSAARTWGANERIRVAVIGTRNRGNQVASNLAAAGADVAVFCDCDRAMYERGIKEARIDPVPAFEQDFRKVLERKDIDAVVIAAPDHWHGLMTVLALDAGKHVYVEKPASFNLRDNQAMLRAAARHADKVVIVGTQQRSGAHFQEAAQFVAAGSLGTVGFARAWVVHRRPTLKRVPDADPPEGFDYDLWVGAAPWRPYNPLMTHYNWHFIPDYGTGEMGNWGAHWLDVVRWFLGLRYPSAVSGAAGTFVVRDAKETPDTQTILYEYPGLTVLWEERLWCDKGMDGDEVGAEIWGDKGILRITRGGWTFRPTDGKPEKHGGSEIEVPHAISFLEAIRGTGRPAAPIEEGCLSAALCHYGNVACRAGRRLRIDPENGAIVGDPEASALSERPNRSPWPSFESLGV